MVIWVKNLQTELVVEIYFFFFFFFLITFIYTEQISDNFRYSSLYRLNNLITIHYGTYVSRFLNIIKAYGTSQF